MLLAWLVTTMALWCFAFYRSGNDAQDWITRAQNVCFGTSETGLPDGWGWMVLTLAPLSFLVALIVTFASELRFTLRRFSRSIIARVVVVSLLGLVVGEGVWVAGRISEGLAIADADYSSALRGDLPDGYPRGDSLAPTFALVDHTGAQIGPDAFRGKSIILTFAFAHCQTICPALVATARLALEELPRDRTELLVITLDPWRDTPSSLPALKDKWQLPDNARVLSGSVEEVQRILKVYNIPTSRDERTGDVVHPGIVYVIAPDSTLMYTFNNPPQSWLARAATIAWDTRSERKMHG